ncbi:hypothetical protein EDB85DRAFT_1890357 [Lactarius pseudohatsudake]|nr:hypothetical protein EDB85DRAFT_1890357 [Lactarius pseudohatsudake]
MSLFLQQSNSDGKTSGAQDALTKNPIASAFKKIGIYPINCRVFSEQDFAPSKVSSTITHVPGSFPSDFPSSDPIEPSDDNMWPESGDNKDHDSDLDPEDADLDAGRGTDSESGVATPDLMPGGQSCSLAEGTQEPSTTVARDNPIVDGPVVPFLVAPPRTVSLEEDKALTNYEDLLTELRSVRQTLATTHKALLHALGRLSAANAHCTKIQAHFVTSRALRSEFDREEAERQDHERSTVEKEKKKEAKDAEQALQFADDALNRDFTSRLAAYKKDDLRPLAIAISV